jgi:hypothetical protein
MGNTNLGANEFTIEELEELFNDTIQSTTPATETNTEAQESDDGDDKSTVENTKAFAHRLKQSTDKARKEERESIAKSLGYESYDDMLNKREAKTLEDKGLDPDEVKPVVDELVKQRLATDPRMAELEEFRKQKIVDFGTKELAEITKLTNGKITEFSQLPKEVLNLWVQRGSLKSAYLELEGEKLIMEARSGTSKGSTDHMQSMSGGAPTNNNQRHLTEQEKAMWKYFNPGISDEELNKKLVDR